MMLQSGEDLIEMFVRDPLGDTLGNGRAVAAFPLVLEPLHRIAVCVRTPSATGSIKRERIDDWAAASLQVEVVEQPQDRLVVRPSPRSVLGSRRGFARNRVHDRRPGYDQAAVTGANRSAGVANESGRVCRRC